MQPSKVIQWFIAAFLVAIWSVPIPACAEPSEKSQRAAKIELLIRRYAAFSNEESLTSETEGTYHEKRMPIDLDHTALILLDVWKNHEDQPDDGWLDKKQTNIERKIVPLLALARQHGLTIIHTPHRQEIADEAKPLPGEIVCNPKNPDNSQIELLEQLRQRHITTLLYAGYTSNLCLLYRPVGILPMRALGYRTILLRDCTITYVPKNLGEESSNESDKHAVIKAVEPLWGTTTTLEELQRALQARNP